MAYNWLIPQDFRFSGDPFVYGGKQYYGPGGLLPDYDPSQGPIAVASGDQTVYEMPRGVDYWAASPELAARDSRWNDWTQSEVVGAGDGWYDVKLKSGDKEGSIVRIQQDPQTGEWVNGGVQGTVGWNTNSPAIPPEMAAVMLAGLAATAGPSLMGSLGGTAGGGAAGGGAASAGGTSSIFGPGGAFSGAGLTSTGLPGVTSLGVPASLGGDALLAGSSLSGALGGAGATGGLLSAGIPVTAGAGLNALQVGAAGGIPVGATAGFGLPAGGFPGAGVSGNATISPPTSPIEVPPTPPTTPSGTTPPGTTPPGTTPPGSPPGGPDGGFKMPSGWEDWLKLLGPVIGGGLAAWDATRSQGENPQDPWSRDYLRGLLTGPQPTNQSSGLLGTIGQLQGKRYY